MIPPIVDDAAPTAEPTADCAAAAAPTALPTIADPAPTAFAYWSPTSAALALVIPPICSERRDVGATTPSASSIVRTGARRSP